MLLSFPKVSSFASNVKVVNKLIPLTEVSQGKFFEPAVGHMPDAVDHEWSFVIPATSPLVNCIKEPVFAFNKPVLFTSGYPVVTSKLLGPVEFRLIHTDGRLPGASEVRQKTRNPSELEAQSGGKDRSGNPPLTVMIGAGICGASALILGKSTIAGSLSSFLPASSVMGMASLEVDLGKIPAGKTMTFHWRGKPIYIRHRTTEQIETESKVDITSLRDMQHDDERTVDQRFLIVSGICTHMGGAAISNAGAYGGFFCPCHGSHYDGSGRIRTGPAPSNLEVPKHKIVGQTAIIG